MIRWKCRVKELCSSTLAANHCFRERMFYLSSSSSIDSPTGKPHGKKQLNAIHVHQQGVSLQTANPGLSRSQFKEALSLQVESNADGDQGQCMYCYQLNMGQALTNAIIALNYILTDRIKVYKPFWLVRMLVPTNDVFMSR